MYVSGGLIVHTAKQENMNEKESESRPAPWRSWAGLRDPDDPR